MNKRNWTPLEPFGGTARKRAANLSRLVRYARNRASSLVGMCPVWFSRAAGFATRCTASQTQVRRSASLGQTQTVDAGPTLYEAIAGIPLIVDPDCPPDKILFVAPAVLGEEHDVPGMPKIVGVINNVGVEWDA